MDKVLHKSIGAETPPRKGDNMKHKYEIIGKPLFEEGEAYWADENGEHEKRYEEQEHAFFGLLRGCDEVLFRISVFEGKSNEYAFDSVGNYMEYIQYLAIKDGVDLVRFDNGNIGFVAYYTSGRIWKSYLEVVTDADTIATVKAQEEAYLEDADF